MGTTIRRLLSFLVLAAATAGTANAVQVTVRDAATGAPLAATIRYPDQTGTRRFAVDANHHEVAAPSTTVRASASAPGYHELRFRLAPGAAPITLLLDPLAAPRDATQGTAAAPARRLEGYVRDDASGAAIAGATIEFAGLTTRSDASGHFVLDLPACDADAGSASLAVTASDGRRYQRDGILCANGSEHVLVALGASAVSHSVDSVGALDRSGGVGLDFPARLAAAVRAAPMVRVQTPLQTALAPSLTPPASIRVGFADAACTQSCCTGSCGHVCTMSLETYVRRGLNDEWIASWAQTSLRAGSVAYRSYGAWHVAHPKRASYDICSSACCQVNDPDTFSATDAAVARTPGVMLTYSGSEPARSEYSAENNSWDDPNDGLNCTNTDLSCGDGYAGSPGSGWPCLADPVSSGHGCFGHGRGMSQWGSQRWATDASGHRWPWVVDHYYNDLGNGSGQRTAVMSSPLTLGGIDAQPAAPAPGSTLTIHASADNAAGASHQHLMIGASLYRGGVGYIDDPAHDTALVLAPGNHAITRPFTIPAGTPAGNYDLLLSLYLDVDENGAVSGTDLPLALVTVADAVQIVDDRIFRNGFEPAP